MKTLRSKAAAFNLIEVMVALAIVAIAGGGVVEILRTGTILFGKNTAINLSHAESRYGLLKFQNDLASAVATPELTGSGTPLVTNSGISTILSGTATGPAAGVCFQAYAGGPFCLYVPASTSTISGSASSIQVITGTNFRPVPGETIHIQVLPVADSLVEDQLSGSGPYTPTTTSAGTTYTPTLVNTLGSSINVEDPVSGNALHVACFFTTPIVYVVQNGRFVKYTLDPAGSGTMLPTVLSYNVTSTTPFSMPTVNSSPSNTFVQVQNLTATDPSSNQRGYKAVLTPFTVQVPHFSQLTVEY
jgi:prepilin-type N-terminal cleavage/methylation domain-containing protein